ncbi:MULTISPECIES: LysR family transcriptional regulator [Bacillus]|uniref:HTH lysR-type domain-containing protein n=1 Tax=Bacillus safensis TaxID=561879 RepID=A0A5C0WMJ7_BACIA|nr:MULTISPECIES: LysR family transcriptional regulator [Bacillus]QEK65294.1 hypothetical protein FX981_03564 [Bacillus safensis]UPI93653.1 LysR family transcriptional regulator [Bacillus safensis]WNF52627.1 LysR family transcriptional regulator [Bacillus sp. SG20001]
MNIRDFEIFKTIADCGSFSRASEKRDDKNDVNSLKDAVANNPPYQR